MRPLISLRHRVRVIDKESMDNAVNIMVMKVKMIELEEKLLAVSIESAEASKEIERLKKK